MKHIFIAMRRCKSRRLFILVCICAASLISCSSKYLKTKEFDRVKFNKERSAWNSLNISSYQFTENLFYGAPNAALRITVTNGVRTNAEVLDGRDPDYEARPFADSIEDIFARVESDFDADSKILDSQTGDLIALFVEITYDETYHYPVRINYTRVDDKDYSSTVGHSDGYILNIKDFRRL